MQSSTACQSRLLVSENEAVPSLHVPIVVNEFCLPVKVSPVGFRTCGMQPCGNDWPGGWDCHMKISGHFIHFFPLKKPLFSLFGMPSSPSDFLLSTLAPKWAALTLTQCTQHCVPISHLHVPHQIFTPTCFSTVFQVSSCLTHLLTPRTVYILIVKLERCGIWPFFPRGRWHQEAFHIPSFTPFLRTYWHQHKLCTWGSKWRTQRRRQAQWVLVPYRTLPGSSRQKTLGWLIWDRQSFFPQIYVGHTFPTAGP